MTEASDLKNRNLKVLVLQRPVQSPVSSFFSSFILFEPLSLADQSDSELMAAVPGKGD